MAMSDYLANELLDHSLGTGAYTAPTQVYVALFSTVLTKAGTGTELSGNGYARVAVDFGAAASRVASNSAEVLFTASGGAWDEVLFVGYYDALTTGNLLYVTPVGGAETLPFTGLAADDVVTSYAHGYSDTDRVVLYGDDLPTGLSEETIYFVRDASTDTFKLAATEGGAAINFTASGGGIVKKLSPRTLADGDKFSFAAGAIDMIFP